MCIQEFFFKGPIGSFNMPVYPWTSWIDKEVFNLFLLKVFIKLTEELGTIISLNNMNSSFIRIDSFKLLEEGNCISAA